MSNAGPKFGPEPPEVGKDITKVQEPQSLPNHGRGVRANARTTPPNAVGYMSPLPFVSPRHHQAAYHSLFPFRVNAQIMPKMPILQITSSHVARCRVQSITSYKCRKVSVKPAVSPPRTKLPLASAASDCPPLEGLDHKAAAVIGSCPLRCVL
jgi:hypothetical protein